MILGVNRQRQHDSKDVLELLAKDQDDLLQPFQDCRTSPMKPLSGHKKSTRSELEKHVVFLFRSLLELAGGRVDSRQRAFEQEYTFNENFDLYMIIVGVAGDNPFGEFNLEEMCATLRKSKVFNKSTFSKTAINKLIVEMMECLPLGVPKESLVIPESHEPRRN